MARTPSADEYLPLLRTQQNEAFGWVEGAGFDPRSFEVGPAEWGETQCTRFAYKGSPYFFDVSTARHTYSVRHSPGSSELITHLMSHAQDFQSLEGSFSAWLSFLRREVEAPDLWMLAHDGPTLFSAGGVVSSNDPFSAPELAQIAIAVDRVRVYLVEVGVGGDLLRESNSKLDYLVAASRRSGRFDWFNLAFSIVWSIVVAAAFAPDQARVLFETLGSEIRKLIGP
jgi:hypothetical protein